MKLRLVQPEDERPKPFVCTWCAERFASKAELYQHRVDTPACKANQSVSNPLQTKYRNVDVVATQPGEYTLHRVRAATCPHAAERQQLVDNDGATIGWQCGYCYSILPSAT